MTCAPLDAASRTSSVALWILVALLDPAKSCIRPRRNVWATVKDKCEFKI